MKSMSHQEKQSWHKPYQPDDTSSSIKGKLLHVLLRMMEEDAKNLLNFMKTNGLVANPSKTAFLLLNARKHNENKIEIKIGDMNIERQQNCVELP